MENPILELTDVSVTLGTVIVDAKEDGKINWVEWIKIVHAVGNVIKASTEVKAENFEQLTESEMETLATIAMSSTTRELRFVHADVVDTLKALQSLFKIAVRER